MSFKLLIWPFVIQLMALSKLVTPQVPGAESGEEEEQLLYKFEDIEWRQILVTLVVAWVVVLVSRWLLRWLAARLPGRFRLHILPLVPVLRLLVITGAIFRIFPLIVNITANNVIAVVGALGVALGFAFKDYVSSLLAGIVTIYERPYRTGDWVQIGDDYGEVRNVGLRALQLRTPDDNIVTIPHTKLWDSNISNANDGQRTHQCIAHFYLHPEHDAQQARQKLWDVAMTSPYTQLMEPVVVIVQEQPWGTHYKLKAYPIDSRNEFVYITDLTIRGKVALAQLGGKPAVVTPAVSHQD